MAHSGPSALFDGFVLHLSLQFIEASPAIQNAIGSDRLKLLNLRLEALSGIVKCFPETTISVQHLEIPLHASTPLAAENELRQILNHSEPNANWHYIIRLNEIGGRFGHATRFLKREESASYTPEPELASDILFFDIFTQIGAYLITHVWRVVDLIETCTSALASWTIVNAALSSRALIESAAVFSSETVIVADLWENFRTSGTPELSSVDKFRDDLRSVLIRASYATRVKELEARNEAKNIVTYLKKFAKRFESANVENIYDWLSDACHPQFGFRTTYLNSAGVDWGNTHALEFLCRKALEPAPLVSHSPTVALNVVDGIILAAEALYHDITRLRTLLFDFGLTTGIAYRVEEVCFGAVSRRLTPNEICICGSKKKFKKCTHEWEDRL